MSKDFTKFSLIEDIRQYLLDLHIYIPDFLKFLWEQPVIFSTLLCNSDIKDIKKTLAPFICNNFYENILSSYSIEGHLICFITLILKKEISDLKNFDNTENFLNETAGFYFLKELATKSEVQYLFENTMVDFVEKMEVSYSSKKINFNVEKIVKDVDKIKQEIEKTNKNIKNIEKEIFRKNFDVSLTDSSMSVKENAKEISREKEFVSFNSKYIPNLTKNELEKIISNSSDSEIRHYCRNKIKIINEKKKEIYTNEKLLDKILKSPFSTIVLALYQHDFCLLIKLIDELLKNLFNNIQLISYPLKCFCKIILELIKKKFKNTEITKTQEYSFVAKFFFTALILPILRNPATAGLINNFIISGITMNNLKILCDILNQLVLGNFFINDEKQYEFTTFNWYFIEKMPFILKIFDEITDVELPKFLIQIIENDDLSVDFNYDYFSEHPNEIIFHRSFCFKLDDITTLIKNMSNCKKLLFNDCKNNKKLNYLKINFEKISSKYYLKLIENLKKNKALLETDQEQKNSKKESYDSVNYYLISEIIMNPKYKNLNDLEQKKPYFSIKELKTIENDEQLTQNNIIKVKNFFSGLLYNYLKLSKSDFDIGISENNTITILKKLKYYLKSYDYTIDGKIPLEWYVNSLLEYLKKIPKNLTDKDNEKLFDELENDVNNSIQELDFDIMGECLDKIKFIKKKISYFEQAKKLIIDVELNQRVKDIIENIKIPAEMSFKYNMSQKIFDIKKYEGSDKKQLEDYHETKDGNKICLTIESFTKIFPNIVNIVEVEGLAQFQIEKKMQIPEKIEKYLKIVKEELISKKIAANTNDYQIINDTIYDFVMNKIYEKLYSTVPCIEDMSIFRKCYLLSWTEPKNFIKAKNNIGYDNFLPDILNYFHQIDKEKSPRKKIINMMKIFESIGYAIELNEGKGDYGIDDILPILNYAVVKSQPVRMCSNSKYMELFIGDKNQGDEDHKLSIFDGLCKYIQNMSYEDLGVSKEEYDKNCVKAMESKRNF